MNQASDNGCPDYEVRYCCDANTALNQTWIQIPEGKLRDDAG